MRTEKLKKEKSFREELTLLIGGFPGVILCHIAWQPAWHADLFGLQNDMQVNAVRYIIRFRNDNIAASIQSNSLVYNLH